MSDLEAMFAAPDFYAKPRSEIFELETQLKTARHKVAHFYARWQELELLKSVPSPWTNVETDLWHYLLRFELLPACFAATACPFCRLVALFFVCFCVACFCLSFGDLSPMAQRSTVAGFPLACHAEAYASPARTEVMSILQTQPDAKEVCVKKVYPLRFAGDPSQEKYDQLFQLAQRFDAQVERTAPLGLL